MKAVEKQLIYTLLKTADAYECGYTRKSFAVKPEFTDDIPSQNNAEVISTGSITANTGSISTDSSSIAQYTNSITQDTNSHSSDNTESHSLSLKFSIICSINDIPYNICCFS